MDGHMDHGHIRLQAPKLARKCEIEHWYAYGGDGHVIAKFTTTDKAGGQIKYYWNNFQKYVTSMGGKMSP